MKKLLILPLLVLLTACVQYYYPETAMEDGVYYAEDDPKYMVFQGGDPGAMYYPWASLDYFYLGYNPYPVYPYYTGFPFGYFYGYSPWYYPYTRHGFYSPLYASYYRYPFFPVWRPYYGYCWNGDPCGHRPGVYTDGGQNRFAGNQQGHQRNDDDQDARDDISDDRDLTDNLDNLKAPGKGRSKSYNSYMLTMPPGYSGYGGMVVRSNEPSREGKSTIQPVKSGIGSGSISIAPSPSIGVMPGTRSAGTSTAASRNAGTSSRQAPSQSSGMSAPRRSSGVSNRSRPDMPAPRSGPSKTGSSRPVRDLD